MCQKSVVHAIDVPQCRQKLGGTHLDPDLPTDEWKIIDQASVCLPGRICLFVEKR